jgi:hypothetical protein
MFRSWCALALFGLIVAAGTMAKAQYVPPAEAVIEYLGLAHLKAAACGRPTAPIEQMLERYIAKSGTGPLEAGRLRQKMMYTAESLRGLTTNCSSADRDIAELMASAQQKGRL